MQTGFIGDIHGDIEALTWALDVLQGADRIISLGDVVDGPKDRACIQLLQAKQVQVVQGNHDNWAGRDLRVGNARTADEREWLSNLPRQVQEPDWLAYHSRYFTVHGVEIKWEYLFEEEAVRRALDEHASWLTFCGHTHVPAVDAATDADFEHLGVDALKACPRIQLDRSRRYVINAGRPTQCVVSYHGGEAPFIQFHFRPIQAPPARPARSWWQDWIGRLARTVRIR